MNYSWQILKLGLQDEINHEGKLHENAVVEVKWRRTAEDTDGTRGSYVGNSTFSAADISVADFIAVTDLTSAQVIGWVENSIEAAELKRIDDQISRKVERNRMRTVRPNW